jgi:hypothetical protein
MDRKLSLTTKAVHPTISLIVSMGRKMIQVLPFPGSMSQEMLPGKHLFIHTVILTVL